MFYWVRAEGATGVPSSWMRHDTIEIAREDAQATLETGFPVSYIFPGDADDPHDHLDYLEKYEREASNAEGKNDSSS